MGSCKEKEPYRKRLYYGMGKGVAKEFGYCLRGDKSTRLTEMKQRAAEKKILFEGDSKRGKFSGGLSMRFVGDMTIRGRYKIIGDVIIVTVLKKPSLYTWEQVDTMLGDLAEGGEPKEMDRHR